MSTNTPGKGSKGDSTPESEDRYQCEAVFTGSSRSPLCNNIFEFQLLKSPAFTDPAEAHNKSLVIKSNHDFTVDQIAIDFGPYKGRTAVVFNPRPAGQKAFPFMKLPAEVRRMIYRELLVTDMELEFSGRRGRLCSPEGLDEIHPKILLVSKDIRAEALGIALAENGFSFSTTTHAERFLSSIGAGVNHITHIAIRQYFYQETGRRMLRQLPQARNLQYIALPGENLPRHFIYYCRKFLEIRGVKSGTGRSFIRTEVNRLVGMIVLKHKFGQCSATIRAATSAPGCDCAGRMRQRLQDLKEDLLLGYRIYD
ncbi:hypothetical protein BDZ85DRAFT_64529 [Elsinoe ampelina]|uniref:Uncharacterized protein n=1 Tax=Elsinoe ampelina TaxID=302913 RepID=A0A6A6FZA0_9PEZI|nr:hypothetical protein BDZ85DRAFT_64529 [Elsinoe ampelina]